MKHLIALTLVCFTLSAYGQNEVVQTEIVTISLDEPVDGLYFHNGKEVSRFRANPTGLGEPLAYKGPPRFILRTSEAEFTATPPLPAPHAWVDLPLQSERVLIACIKSANAPLRLVVYDIAKARIDSGDYRFFNFSHSVISVIMGQKKFAVKPGENSLVADAAWKKEVGEIDVTMAMIKDGKPKPVYSSQWGNRPGRRNYIFLFDGPQDYKPIRICRFFDVPPTTPEKKDP
jgi:hypothetical protein